MPWSSRTSRPIPPRLGRRSRFTRATLLEGIDAAAPEFDDWLKPERARLAALAERALEQLAQTAGRTARLTRRSNSAAGCSPPILCPNRFTAR